MLSLNIKIESATEDEMVEAIKEALRNIEIGNVTGENERENGEASVSYETTGQEENVPTEEETDLLDHLGYNVYEKGTKLSFRGEIIENDDFKGIDYPNRVFSRADASKIHLLGKIKDTLKTINDAIDDYDNPSKAELNDLVDDAIELIDSYPDEDDLDLNDFEGDIGLIVEKAANLDDIIDESIVVNLMALFIDDGGVNDLPSP